MISRCRKWPDLGSQPPPRSGHLRQCDTTLYEAPPSLQHVIYSNSAALCLDLCVVTLGVSNYNTCRIRHRHSFFTQTDPLCLTSPLFADERNLQMKGRLMVGSTWSPLIISAAVQVVVAAVFGARPPMLLSHSHA